MSALCLATEELGLTAPQVEVIALMRWMPGPAGVKPPLGIHRTHKG
jgi:hypothetical protein